MATKYYCDRCDKVGVSRGFLNQVRILDTEIEWDLCDNCCDELKRWIKDYAHPAPKENKCLKN